LAGREDGPASNSSYSDSGSGVYCDDSAGATSFPFPSTATVYSSACYSEYSYQAYCFNHSCYCCYSRDIGSISAGSSTKSLDQGDSTSATLDYYVYYCYYYYDCYYYYYDYYSSSYSANSSYHYYIYASYLSSSYLR
jgi:hypothetical protein